MSFLGLDLGTSGLRALVVDGSGVPVYSTERQFSSSYPKFGWAEQHPDDWVFALEGIFEELKVECREFPDIKGIGVAGQMHGATLLDKSGRVLRKCILWNDTRSHLEASQLDAIEAVRKISGNIVFPGFTAPKLLWVRKHEEEIFRSVDKVLLPAAYLNHYLTGEFVADMSDSAGTSWLDTGNRVWSDTLLAAGAMSKSQMPKLVEGSSVGGNLRADLAKRWGLSCNIVVAGGAGDNAAAACGIGALNEGEGFVSLGTSGVVLVARSNYVPDPDSAVHTFCHAIPNRWYQMGVMLSATDCLNWLSRILKRSPEELTNKLGEGLKAPGQESFLPYLSGERTPHNDANIRGNLSGISIDTSEERIVQSVLEGVAFGLKDSFEAVTKLGGTVEHLSVVGGGAKSDYWVELIATVLGVPLRKPLGGEFGAALGAARLGICAATNMAPDEVMKPPKFEKEIGPNTALTPQFEEAYGRFKKAYPTISKLRQL